MIIHISISKVYRVGGVTFEWRNYLGPTIINRHTGDMRNIKNVSLRNWAMINKFCRMSEQEKENHRIF